MRPRLARKLWFAIPGDIDTRTGGTIYDKQMMAELLRMGWEVEHLAWPTSFPFPSAADIQIAAESLAVCPDGALVLIDGLAFGVLPDVAAAAAQRLNLAALVHHPLALESGLSPNTARSLAASERQALAHVRAIIVTSELTAATLRADYGIGETPVTVAKPGIHKPGPYPRPRNPVPHLLSVGTVSPRKAHDILVESLALISDLEWRCTIAGSLDRSPKTTANLRELISKYSMDYLITLTGEVSDMDPLYRTADILISSSRYEGYGMAIAEALAYGLPVVAANAGAIPDVVPEYAGILVPPGDPMALAAALRRLLGDAAYCEALATGAAKAALELAGWSDTAAQVASALDAI
jgi:glycosyltransferase involved in cell wall biosynthesis